MAKRPAGKPPMTTKIVVKYENLDLPPAYVEGAQGMRTSQGALHVSFYSEYVKSKEEIRTSITLPDPSSGDPQTVQVTVPDPFQRDDGEIRIVRRVESNLVFTTPVLRSLIPWLQQKLLELETNSGSGITRVEQNQ